MTMLVIDFEEAHIVQGASSVTLQSVAVFTAEAMAGMPGSPEITYHVADEPAALDATAYPSLAAVWDNEEDAVFDEL